MKLISIPIRHLYQDLQTFIKLLFILNFPYELLMNL